VEEIREDGALSSRSESSNELSGLAKGTLGESVLRAHAVGKFLLALCISENKTRF
jgi:hypothetical protein